MHAHKSVCMVPNPSCLATVDAADAHPDENPPRAEDADDAVEEVVGTVIVNVDRLLCLRE